MIHIDNGKKACILYCRPGFEPDVISELRSFVVDAELPNSAIQTAEGFVALFDAGRALSIRLSQHSWMFARQLLQDCQLLDELPVADRVGAITAHLKLLNWTFSDIFLETPDTNDGKSLSGLFKKMSGHLERAIETAHLIDKSSPYRVHLFFLSGTQVWVGRTLIEYSNPWLMGIPRLKLPPNAPSRACMKLEEALSTLLTADDQKRLLKPGMKVVDLGAAPGGWTWQMVRRNMFVTAVDNGPMNKELMATGQVEHARADGFKFKPRKKVNWFLCDIVDKPSRVAQLVAEWVKNGYSDNYIFNLKLPMKKRVDEIEKCKEKIIAAVPKNRKYKLVIKQLYHDRQEVTCFLSLAA